MKTTVLVSVYQRLIFVHLGLRSILVLCKRGKMGEDEVLVNDYFISGNCSGEYLGERKPERKQSIVTVQS